MLHGYPQRLRPKSFKLERFKGVFLYTKLFGEERSKFKVARN